MSKRTKPALAKALMDLLQEKQFDKITVQDVTEKCDLTRNTFYYHFKDLNELLLYVFTSELDKIKKNYHQTGKWSEGLLQLLDFVCSNRESIANIYNSISSEAVFKFINGISYHHIYVLVTHKAPDGLPSSVYETVAKFYRDALIGSIIDWFSGNMKTSPEDLVKSYSTMVRGTFSATVQSAIMLK